MKVVASDSPSHSPGEALTGFKESDRFEVDTTPPVVTNLKAAEEAGAPCAAGALRQTGYCSRSTPRTLDRPSATPSTRSTRARGNTSSRSADCPIRSASTTKCTFRPPPFNGKPGEHLLTVRAYDRHDNVGLAKTVFQTTSGSAAK